MANARPILYREQQAPSLTYADLGCRCDLALECRSLSVQYIDSSFLPMGDPGREVEICDSRGTSGVLQ